MSICWTELNTTRYLEYINTIICARGQWHLPEDGVYHNHHIIPKCIGGEPLNYTHETKHTNLVWLTPQEHYDAHKILALDNLDVGCIVNGWWCMSNYYGGIITTGKEYDILYRAALKYNIESHTGVISPMRGKHYSDEVKQRVSAGTKLAMANPQVRLKLSIADSGRIPWNKGLTKETDSRLTDLGNKISSKLSGRKLTEEHKLNIGLGGIGHEVSVETREKISLAQRGENCTKNKAVICIETGIIYYNAKYANEQTGVNHSNIIQCCKGNRITAGNFHWSYA